MRNAVRVRLLQSLCVWRDAGDGRCGDGRGNLSAGGGTGSASGGTGGTPADHAQAGADAGEGGARGQDAGAQAGRPGAAGAGGTTHEQDGGGATDARSGSGADAAVGPLSKLSLFYLDVTGGRVLTANAQTRPPGAGGLRGPGPRRVAVDVAGGHVYWTGMGVPSANDGFIMRADLDGTNVKTLVPAGGTYTPKQMKLDLAGGKMYSSGIASGTRKWRQLGRLETSRRW